MPLFRNATGAAVLALLLATATGCGPGYGYTEVSYAPYDLGAYPTAYYGGRTVYLIDNRWMYPNAGAWFYYPTEPAYLYQQRSYYYGGRSYGYGPGYGPSYAPRVSPGYSAPQARSRPYVQQAPPATLRATPSAPIPRTVTPMAPSRPGGSFGGGGGRMSAPPARR